LTYELGTAADRRPTLPADDIYDDFDELLDASSLGSSSAEEIQRLVPESVRHVLEQRIARRAAPHRRLDVDDALLDLVSVLQTNPDDNHPLPVAPPDNSAEPTPCLSHAGAESKLHEVPHRMRVTLWHAVEPLDTAERLLQVLVEEDAIADVREDVGRALVAAAFSRPAVSSVVLNACLSAMPKSRIGDTLADQLAEQWLPRLAALTAPSQPRDAVRTARLLFRRGSQLRAREIRALARFSINSIISVPTTSWTAALRRTLQPRLSPIPAQITRWMVTVWGHDCGILPLYGWIYCEATAADLSSSAEGSAGQLPYQQTVHRSDAKQLNQIALTGVEARRLTDI
jgi:hypothetical protein